MENTVLGVQKSYSDTILTSYFIKCHILCFIVTGATKPMYQVNCEGEQPKRLYQILVM